MTDDSERACDASSALCWIWPSDDVQSLSPSAAHPFAWGCHRKVPLVGHVGVPSSWDVESWDATDPPEPSTSPWDSVFVLKSYLSSPKQSFEAATGSRPLKFWYKEIKIHVIQIVFWHISQDQCEIKVAREANCWVLVMPRSQDEHPWSNKTFYSISQLLNIIQGKYYEVYTCLALF